MQYLERYKVLSGDKNHFNWVSAHGMYIGYDYPCIGFSKQPGTLPPLIHLIVNGKIVSSSYTEDRFELVHE
jgi:hypothetical protein